MFVTKIRLILVRNWREIDLSVSPALTTNGVVEFLPAAAMVTIQGIRLRPPDECKAKTHSLASIFNISSEAPTSKLFSFS